MARPDHRSRARPEPGPAGHKRAVARDVDQKARRRLRARQERDRGVWFGLGMFGLVGWAVAVPTLAGIALGLWLDAQVDGAVSWTLTGLFAGVILGCVNAWFWVRRESSRNDA